MVDWMLFDTIGDTLYIKILTGRLIELIPDSIEETDEFCQELYPVIDKIQQMCIDQNLKQVGTTDLKDVVVANIKPLPLIRLIWNIYNHTKSNILLTKFNASGADPFVKIIVEAVKAFLPPFMINIITV